MRRKPFIAADPTDQPLLDRLVAEEIEAIAAAKAKPRDEALHERAKQARNRRCLIRVSEGSGLSFWKGSDQ